MRTNTLVSIEAERSALRRQMRSWRAQVSAENRALAAMAAATHLAKSGLLRATRRIAVYSALRQEFATDPIVRLIAERTGKVYLPRLLHTAGRRMIFATAGSGRRRNRFGIAEALQPEGVNARWLNIVLIPLLAFDAHGNRLGMGAGYYLITSTGVSGNTVAGGAYQLDIKTPNTFGVTARIGSDWNLGSRFRIGIAASHSMTFKDYTVTDTVSGQQGRIRPFSPVGIAAQLGYRF